MYDKGPTVSVHQRANTLMNIYKAALTPNRNYIISHTEQVV